RVKTTSPNIGSRSLHRQGRQDRPRGISATRRLRFTRFEAGLLSENLANRLGVGDQRVSRKLQAFDRPLSGFFVASAAGVSHKHGNVTEIGAMADRRLNSYLGRDADNDKGVDAAIS